jgi:hypothetical protein
VREREKKREIKIERESVGGESADAALEPECQKAFKPAFDGYCCGMQAMELI